jgi:hypothetical protein
MSSSPFSTDELPIYDGYPLATACGTSCACPTSGPAACSPCTGGDGTCSFPSFTSSLPDTSKFLDPLAASGVVFRSAYSNTLCSPTRATMQTGRYGFRTGSGIASPPGGSIGPLEQTIPKVLHQFAPGYSTAAIGKWHLSDAPQCDNCGPVSIAEYDYFAGTPHNIGDFCSWPRIVIDQLPAGTSPSCSHQFRRVYATKDNVDDAIRWICQLPACGDGYCASGETCPADCPSACGNATCDAGENYLNCWNDCSAQAAVCGNGICELGEDYCLCPNDNCPGPEQETLPVGCQPRDQWFLWLGFNAPPRTTSGSLRAGRACLRAIPRKPSLRPPADQLPAGQPRHVQ